VDYYIFAADVYCPHCADEIKRRLADVAPANPDDETTYDSGDYPKGPFSDDSSDTPHNCANCGDYIEGPLTEDGVDYVIDAMQNDIDCHHTNSIVRDWASHLDKGLGYNLTPHQKAVYDHYTEKFANNE
jgi:hypothetical protein